MKNTILTLLITLTCTCEAGASDYKSLSWANICSGKMAASWYASDEARSVTDTLISVQKTNGGWMKNDQFHKLTATELSERQALRGNDNARNAHSCFDNYATTQEMRFLLRVYRTTSDETLKARCLASFKKALSLIITAGKGKNGGWGQYWPDPSDQYSYQRYITFNDDLMTNIMKMLQEVYEAKGDFADLVDGNMRTQCKQAWDDALQCVLNCQIDDNGTKSAWCAQHDPTDFQPTEGRPHELPSVSAAESATLLSYLMSIERPSAELKEAIRAAVAWFDNHKYMANKYIEDVKDGSGNTIDRVISNKIGSNIWGRFIQLGGAKGQEVYTKFYNKLKARGKTRTHHSGGYTYKEYEILEESYDSNKEYQPIFAIYSNDYPELFYRHLYKYDGPDDDSENVTDKHGMSVRTSLPSSNRISYQYLGSWCDAIINTTYPAWEQRMANLEAAGDNKDYVLSGTTYSSSNSTTTWNFSDGFSVSNSNSKGYATGMNNTVKYSTANYTITIPSGLVVEKVSVNGYDNYDSGDGYISNMNGTNYTSTKYVFPRKDSSGNAVYANHVIDFSANPVSGTLTFGIGGKQCCLIITLYCKQPFTTNTGKWASLTPKYDCSLPDGAKAYIITNVDGQSGAVTASEVSVLKAGEGYFIKGEASTTYKASAAYVTPDATTGNLIVGCTKDVVLSGKSGYTQYVLGIDNGQAGLYYIGNNSVTVPAGKAYLEVPGTLQAKTISLDFADGTGIEEINTDNKTTNIRKTLRDGQLMIETPHGTFTLGGAKLY